MRVIPLNDCILVREETAEEVSKHGVASARDKGERTESVAPEAIVVSTGVKNNPVKIKAADGVEQEVKVGDKVLVAKWEIHKAKVDAKDHFLVKLEHVLAVFAK